MKNEVIITAKTVDEAMAQARRDYSSSENELAFEILEMPKKGFLGFGSTPAKVKVTITKALGDVDLSDLVSSIRNMKITTDRGGEEKPHKQEKGKQGHQNGKPQQNKNQNQNKPQNNNQNNNPNKPQQQPKPATPVKEEKPAANENDLPAALRRPANKPQNNKQNNNCRM